MRRSKKINGFSRLLVAMAVAVVVLAGQFALAADYPERPVTAIVPWNPGGETDTMGRMILERIKPFMNDQKFVVINKPGASGEVGWTFLANSKPDGYTIGLINPPSFVMLPVKRGGECKYNLTQFAPIANVVSDPGTIAVLTDSPYNSVKELIEAAKANPGKITVGTCGPGTSESLTKSRFEQLTGAKFVEVPFDGTAAIMAALLGKHIDVAVVNVSGAYSMKKDGKVKFLGIGASKRSAWFPELQTYKEQGFDVLHVSMRGFAAPAGTDPKIVEKLAEGIRKVLEETDFKAKAEEMKLPLDFMGPAEYKTWLTEANDYYTKLWQTSPW